MHDLVATVDKLIELDLPKEKASEIYDELVHVTARFAHAFELEGD